MSKRAEEYNKEFDSMYEDHTPDLSVSKAEQRALEAYPVRTYRKDQGEPEYSSDYNANDRYRFKEGYELAEKDTIERAVTWLKDNANKYIVDLTDTYPDAPVNIIVGGICWEDLTKYLKDNEQH